MESVVDPQKAISEAIRVSRDRVFVGAWNKYALTNLYGRVNDFLCSSTGNGSVRLRGGIELARWIRNLLPGVPIQWGVSSFFRWSGILFWVVLSYIYQRKKIPSVLCWGFPFLFKPHTEQYRKCFVNL